MHKTLQRGFTLIELLVVIAIIGILAAVVMASLNDARSSGQDASVKQTMANLRSQAEIVYNRAGAFTYTGFCTDANVTPLLNGAADATGAAGTVVTALASPSVNTSASNVVACHETANGSAYAVSAPLTTDGQFWCVDSTGKSSQSGTALIPNATVCP